MDTGKFEIVETGNLVGTVSPWSGESLLGIHGVACIHPGGKPAKQGIYPLISIL